MKPVDQSKLTFSARASCLSWLRASTRTATILTLFLAVSVRASFTLQWGNNNVLGDETGFAIERSDGGAGFIQIGTVNSGSATTYQDTTANSPITYAYRVRAFSAIGYSTYTNVVTNAPTFTTQPVASITVIAGNNATFTGAAAG